MCPDGKIHGFCVCIFDFPEDFHLIAAQLISDVQAERKRISRMCFLCGGKYKPDALPCGDTPLCVRRGAFRGRGFTDKFHIPRKSVLPHRVSLSLVAVLLIFRASHKREEYGGGAAPVFFVRIPHIFPPVSLSFYGADLCPPGFHLHCKNIVLQSVTHVVPPVFSEIFSSIITEKRSCYKEE